MTVQPEADQPKAEIGADLRSDTNRLKTGARRSEITNSARVETGNKEKILTGTSVPLDLPANGRPMTPGLTSSTDIDNTA